MQHLPFHLSRAPKRTEATDAIIDMIIESIHKMFARQFLVYAPLGPNLLRILGATVYL